MILSSGFFDQVSDLGGDDLVESHLYCVARAGEHDDDFSVFDAGCGT